MSASPVILVVDDDRALVKLLVFNLQLEGYQVLTAYDGIEALEQVAHLPVSPNLLLLDLMLPKLDGFAVCRSLRSRGALMPILLLSARGQKAEAMRGLDLSADDYLDKPFVVEELLSRIRALLRRSQYILPDLQL